MEGGMYVQRQSTAGQYHKNKGLHNGNRLHEIKLSPSPSRNRCLPTESTPTPSQTLLESLTAYSRPIQQQAVTGIAKSLCHLYMQRLEDIHPTYVHAITKHRSIVFVI